MVKRCLIVGEPRDQPTRSIDRSTEIDLRLEFLLHPSLFAPRGDRLATNGTGSSITVAVAAATGLRLTSVIRPE